MKINWGQFFIMFSIIWFLTGVGHWYGMSEGSLIAYSFLIGAFWPVPYITIENKETDDV